MELANTETKLKKIGSFDSKSFSIKASAKAFQILSDSLYSDKIAAIIRELSCNAIDAQKISKSERPYDIHLPTWLEPNFWIRDYGTGLSKKDIESIYTTYFESTKNDSNDYIGCLGLGSKTPFSYTNQFTITSFFNGEKYCYSAYINDEDGCPSVALLGESKTDEVNGLKVEFPVSNSDFNLFAEKAKSIYSWFSDLPNIFGQKITIKPFSSYYTSSGINWHVYHLGDNLGYNRSILQDKSYLKMGNISYPIDASKLPHDFRHMEYVNFPIVLDADIGDVDIAPSREALSYNKKTLETLNGRFKKFSEEFSKKINEELSQLSSYGEACKKACNSGYFLNKILKSLIENKLIHYKNEKLIQSISYYMISDMMKNHEYSSFFIWSGHSLRNRYTSHQYAQEYSLIDLDISCGEKKIKDVLIFNGIKSAYILSRKIPLKKREEFLDLLKYDESIVKVFSKLSIPPPEKKKPKIASTIKRKTGDKAWVFHDPGRGVSNPRSFWKESTEIFDFEKSDGAIKVYLNISNFEPISQKLNSISSYRKVIQHLPTIPIYGLTERQQNKIASNSDWINFDIWAPPRAKDSLMEIKKINFSELYFARIIWCASYDMRSFFNKMPKCNLKDCFVKCQKIVEIGGESSNVGIYKISDLEPICGDTNLILEMRNHVNGEYSPGTFKKFISEHPSSAVAQFMTEFKKHTILSTMNVSSQFRDLIPEFYKDFDNNQMFYDLILSKEKEEKKVN